MAEKKVSPKKPAAKPAKATAKAAATRVTKHHRFRKARMR